MTPDYLPVVETDETWNDYATRAHQTGFLPVAPDQWAAQKAAGTEVPVLDVAAPALAAEASTEPAPTVVDAAPAGVTAGNPAGPQTPTTVPDPAEAAEDDTTAEDEKALAEAEADVAAALSKLTADTDAKTAKDAPPA